MFEVHYRKLLKPPVLSKDPRKYFSGVKYAGMLTPGRNAKGHYNFLVEQLYYPSLVEVP